jgi:hypothetical protein
VADVESADGGQHAPGHVERAVGVGIRQQDDELVSAVTRGDVGGPLQRLTNGAGHRGKARVAGAMPVAIVVGLEVVDIDEQHGQRAAGRDALAPTPRRTRRRSGAGCEGS